MEYLGERSTITLPWYIASSRPVVGSTPNDDWDVRALTDHVTSELLSMPRSLDGKTIAEVGDQFDGDVLRKQSVRHLNDAT